MATEPSRWDALHAERGEIARFVITLSIVSGVVYYVQDKGGVTWEPLALSLQVAGLSTALTLVVGIGLAVLLQWRKMPAFFRRKPEVAPAGFLEGEVEMEPVPIARAGGEGT